MLEKLEKSLAIQARSLRATAWQVMKKFVKMQKRKRMCAKLVERATNIRLRKQQRQIIAKMRHVLRLEKLWLKEVRY